MRLSVFVFWSLSIFASFGAPAFAVEPPAAPPVQSLRITILSTMLAEKGVGEWGYSALVEVDGHRLLFDTGNRPNTVLENAHDLNVDLSNVTEVVLSHHHDDHTGGLLSLRNEYAKKNPSALSHVTLSRGAFWSRGTGRKGADENPLIAIRPAYERIGGTFTECAAPKEIFPGVWFLGPIPRVHAEQSVPANDRVLTPSGWKPDDVPDDSALVFDTDKGLVVLTGCGHAGLINTLEYARQQVRPGAKIYEAGGGFHMFRATDEQLAWTAEQLRPLGIEYLHGAHCTGIEALYRLRTLLKLPRENAAVGAVGSWFDLQEGLHAGLLAH
ncbi:MAG TPA: MBL fold metallo-hydrolase [Opitutaceae bacterium]